MAQDMTRLMIAHAIKILQCCDCALNVSSKVNSKVLLQLIKYI